MGFFSKKKKEKKETFKEGLSKIMVTCPSCKNKSLFAIKTEMVGTIMHPTTNLVGEQTGYCANCGLICHGEVYVNGDNYENNKLLELAMLNNTAAYFWLQELFKIAKNGGDHEKAYKAFLGQIREVKGDDIDVAKTDWFIGKCIGYFTQNIQNNN